MQLTHLHLQLTQACNLACGFCGQKHTADGELTVEQWLVLLEEAAQLPVKPLLTIWGGEALISPAFPAVVAKAAEMGFRLELITNGTMLELHSELLREKFSRIYVSVDGPAEVHDSIRGKGVFAAVERNLALLSGGKAEIILMGVLTPDTMSTVSQAPYGLPVDRVIFHELIYLEEGEDSAAGEVWQKNCVADYKTRLAAAIDGLRQCSFPVPAEFQPHGGENICRQIYTHLHISSRGETSFCTDFTHITLGNIQERSLTEIFYGEAAAEQRRKVETGCFPCCRHCAWRNTAETIIKLGAQSR